MPRQLIGLFNDHELELLISGLPDIDVADLRANTEYAGFKPSTPVIQWFWEVVGELHKEDLALLLQFVTGTSRVPLEGFRALQGVSGPQKFQVSRVCGRLACHEVHHVGDTRAFCVLIGVLCLWRVLVLHRPLLQIKGRFLGCNSE